MKVRVCNISERELRLYLQGCFDIDECYKVMIDIIEEYYNGRVVNLVYQLLSGQSGMFRILDEASYITESKKCISKVFRFLPLKQYLDNDNCTEKVCLYVENTNIESLGDVSYMSELTSFLDKVENDYILMDVYWLLLRILDVFIGDLLEFERDDHGNWEENIEIIYVKNKFDNLELVLF